MRQSAGGHKRGWILVALFLSAGISGCGDSDGSSLANGEEGPAANNVCPIMPSKPIDKQFYADYEGKRYYLCCQICVDQFNKNPRRWVARADAMQTLREDIE